VGQLWSRCQMCRPNQSAGLYPKPSIEHVQLGTPSCGPQEIRHKYFPVMHSGKWGTKLGRGGGLQEHHTILKSQMFEAVI
jgi:hypothetical protein